MAKGDLEWATVEGEHFLAEAERYTRMLAGVAQRIVAVAEIQPGESVLDVGCGYGALTLLAAKAADDVRVVGLDVNDTELRHARERARAEGLDNVTFEQGDAQTHALPEGSIDAVISRLGVMFFEDPRAAFTNFSQAVRPDGRLAFAVWRDVSENEHMMLTIRVALEHIPPEMFGDPEALSPFSLSDPDHVREVLESSGWTDVELDPVDESMWWGTDAEDVVDFIAGAGRTKVLLDKVDEETTLRARAALVEALRAHETPDGVFLGGALWLVTARRA
jgi:SAM-dependent methyltransferase